MSSYLYSVLCDFKNYQSDDYNPGLDLYHSLYKTGGLRSTWKTAYLAWLEELCDKNQIPHGEFRDQWVWDCVKNSEYELELIQEWFAPSSDSEPCEACRKEAEAAATSPDGNGLDSLDVMCDH